MFLEAIDILDQQGDASMNRACSLCFMFTILMFGSGSHVAAQVAATTIDDPTSNSTVNVPPGSAKLRVTFTPRTNYYPSSVTLLAPDAQGNPVVFSTATTITQGMGIQYVADIDVPMTATSNILPWQRRLS